MKLKDIAINNLRRRRGKTAFLVCGIVFAVATIVTLYTLTTSMDAGMEKKFAEMGAKVLIVPKTNSVALSYGGITIPSKVSYDVKDIDESQSAKIMAIGKGNIKKLSPKVLGAVSIKDTRVMAVGVQFAKEISLRPYWVIKGLKPKGADQVLVGSRAATRLKLHPGDRFTVVGRDVSKQVTVAGILQETGSEEDGLVFFDLNAAQNLLDKTGKLSLIELNVDRNEQVTNKTVTDLSKALPDAKVKTVKEAMEARAEVVDRFGKFSLMVSIVMLFVSTIMIVTTMLSAVNERTREIGIFRAIGFRKDHIIKIFLTEAGIISGVSGVIGYIIGFVIAMIIAPRIGEANLTVAWQPAFTLIVIAASVVLGLLASLYPANKAAQLDPADALRYM